MLSLSTKDDLEEEMFSPSLSSQVQLVVDMVQSSPTLAMVHKLVWRVETVILVFTLAIIGLSIARYYSVNIKIQIFPKFIIIQDLSISHFVQPVFL